MARSGEVEVRVAGAARDVAAHALAHVAVPPGAAVVTRAASLFDARYVAWSHATLPSRARAPIAADAPLIGELLAREPDGHLLQALLAAFDDEGELTAALRREAAEIADPSIATLARTARELCEITWAAIGLAWPAYREAWHGMVAPALAEGVTRLGAALRDAAPAIPAVADLPVRVSHPLGRSARGFDGCIVVGAPGSWSGLLVTDLAARAIHEVVVRRASALVAARQPALHAGEHWAETEGLALAAATRRLAGHPLAGAHAAFVASLDLSGVRPPDPGLVVTACDALDA